MTSFFSKYWVVVILTIFSISIAWPLFLPGYFSHHDDLQVMRIFEMRRCLTDFQIPCRWVPDMGYGNGFPLFNYYSPLPYYIGAVFSFMVGYIWAAKILFFIPMILGGIAMYFLGKELFGKIGGVAASVLFSFAPYRALDLYIRGDITESFAIAIIPTVFYFVLKLIKEKSFKNFLGVVLSFGTFLLSHNIMIVFFVPVLFFWASYFLYIERMRNLKFLILSLILGFGLSAFFIIPAFFEKNLIQAETLIRMEFNFRANFVNLDQLFFSRFWGYGDLISFQIGWPHWWLAFSAALVLFINLIFRKLKFKENLLLFFLLVIFTLSVFMTHNRSAFIWERIDILKYAQFPWRFLSLTIFSSGLIGGFLVFVFKENKQKYLVAAVILLVTIVLNWNYFRPETFFYSMTDREKLSGIEWEDQQKAAILDYLPKTAYEPREKAPDSPKIISGDAEIKDFLYYSNRWQFETKVFKSARIEIPVFYFPDWQVKVNNLNYPQSHQNLMGRISIDLQPGVYIVDGHLNNTPIRNLANIISILSFGLIITLSFYGKSKKLFK